MRVMFTAAWARSDLRTMLLMASTVAAAGHDVLVAMPPRFAASVAIEGLQVSAATTDPVEHFRRYHLDGGPAAHHWSVVFTGRAVMDNFHALLPVAGRFRPEVIVRDGSDFASCLLAESFGARQVVAPTGVSNRLDPATLLDTLNGHRRRLGLRLADDPYDVFGSDLIDLMPQDYSFAAYPAKRMLRYRQPVISDPADPCLARWRPYLSTGRPLVMAALGTVLPDMTRMRREDAHMPEEMAARYDARALLQDIVVALAGLDCTALVATGGVPVTPPAGADVHVVEHFPQPELLPHARLFLTHGGYNSIREAVLAGVPMVVIPRFGDQPANAERVQRLGLGANVSRPDAAAIAAVSRRLLRDEETLGRARAARQAMRGLPPLEAFPGDLERSAGR
ncbi:glycosyltransferase family 1 protein [Nonomuraea sp. NN258]|uniref:glycosyltransferase n=1 Tax=Nonomuraea antri TaxID=2730852 RepID=UPI001567DA5C|nr:glycosyltransferase [Nonomuraea antri]NRQ35406.1 glycosyltransferase family 1 protein [Nonomuraea antri]